MAQLGFRTIDEMVGRTERDRDAQGGRSLEGARARLLEDPLPARRRAATSAATARSAQDHGLDDVARQHDAARRCASRRWKSASRSRRRCRSATSTASSARSLGSEVTRQYGPEGLPDDTIQLTFQGLGGAELRRVRAARHHADAGRRRQRLRRQGAVGRQDHRLSRRRRRRSWPRTTSSSATSRFYGATGGEALHPRHGGRALLRAQQRRRRRWSRAWATTAAST